MSDPQALHVTRNVIPGKLGVDLHLHRVHIPLVFIVIVMILILLWYVCLIAAIITLLAIGSCGAMYCNRSCL